MSESEYEDDVDERRWKKKTRAKRNAVRARTNEREEDEVGRWKRNEKKELQEARVRTGAEVRRAPNDQGRPGSGSHVRSRVGAVCPTDNGHGEPGMAELYRTESIN